jgi:hypothetical protein
LNAAFGQPALQWRNYPAATAVEAERMNDQEWHEHVNAATLRALRKVREDLNASPRYDNDVPWWPDTIIVHDGLGCWGACATELFAALKQLGWRTEARHAEPPAGQSFEYAYAELCDAVRPRATMTREAMQPLKDGHYPDADTWFEMFGSHPELHVTGDALVYEPERMTLSQHATLLDKSAARYREFGADDIAKELEIRAMQVRADRSGRF